MCVLADAPWSNIGKRNAKTWEESESWKSYPRSSQLVWIVTADKRDRRGLIYSKFKDPKKLLAQLQVYAREDGRLKTPAAKRDWLSVVNRSRARGIPLTRLLQGSQEKLTTKERRRIASARSKLATFLSQISDDELCAGDATKLATRLRADGEEDRARLGKRLDAMLVLAADLKTKGDVVVDVVRKARAKKHRDFVDVTGLRYASIVLHKRLSQQIAKESPLSKKFAERLRKLGAREGKGESTGTPIK